MKHLQSKKITALTVLSYLTVYVVWGTTYYFIKTAVAGIEPYLMVGLRFLTGGFILLAALVLNGSLRKIPSGREILSAIVLGTLLLALGNGLVTLAETRVDSYIAALIVSLTPVTIAIFNRILFGKKIGIAGTAGILLGFAGTALILFHGGSTLSAVTPHTVLVALGMVSFCLGTVISHRLKTHGNIMVHSGMQMLFVGIVCTGAALAIRPASLNAALHAGAFSWFSLGYLVVLGTAAFLAYNHLLANEPSGRISSYALVNPMIAVLVGILVGGEKPAPFLPVGLPMVLAGLFLMFYGRKLLQHVKRKLKINDYEKQSSRE